MNRRFAGEFDWRRRKPFSANYGGGIGVQSEAAKTAFRDIMNDTDVQDFYKRMGCCCRPFVLREEHVLILEGII